MTGRRAPIVAILTCTDDLHALLVEKCLAERFGARCCIIEVDTFASHPTGLSWSLEERAGAQLPIRGGGTIAVSDIDVIWYRRIHLPQRTIANGTDPAYADVINFSCTATLMGILANQFRGRWISDPDATRAAENKLVQLSAARAAGLRIPRTLVSQDPETIRSFCDSIAGRVIMKPLRAARDRNLLTVEVSPEVHLSPGSLRQCPTIFQEYVPGTRHLRVLRCGTLTLAFAIDSADLDWRPNLDVPISQVDLDTGTLDGLERVMAVLNLRMGVFDLKVDDEGPVWLEVNPQGQFLFLEGATGVDVTGPFSSFLMEEARAGVQAPDLMS